MQDRPNATELLEAAANFIEREIVPTTDPSRQFQARVAANVMRIVAREIRLEETQLREELAALSALLGRSNPELASLEQVRRLVMELNEALSARIRAGEADRGPWRSKVLEVVKKIVEDKLEVANPRYLEADRAARPGK